MKYILIVVISFLCCPMILHAQDIDSTKVHKNYIGIDPFLPAFGSVQLNYERAIFNDVSFGLAVGLKSSSGLFEITEIDFNRFNSENLNFSGIKLIPEIRWYFQDKKKGLTGIYAGAYYRYQNYSADLKGTYTSVEDEVSNILIDTNLKSSTIGLELGYKWQFRNGIYIDLLFAGPGWSSNTFTLTEIEPVPEAFYDDLTDALNDIGIIDFVDPDFEVNGNQKTKIALPAWRYGIKIGYAF